MKKNTLKDKMGNHLKSYESYINESEYDREDVSEFVDCLPYLKKVNSGIAWQTVLQWFNQNDIEYVGMSDLDMYIHYIEKNL